jgi:transcriptional regulator with XRE-family HTH domain
VIMAKGKYQEWLTEEGLVKLEGWARDGLTDEQIADNMGINVATLYRWKNDFSEICETLKRGKEVIDRHVENALLKAALGYDYEEEALDKFGEIHSLKRVAHPNTTAMIFWLKNRKPKEWRDKQELEHSGELSFKVTLPKDEIDGAD